ncbi:MAG TPA: proline racemase family protein [Gammaproteobacteria bacterium]|nr:proline racemase family protein [Gammaproteobacteria bacterium]
MRIHSVEEKALARALHAYSATDMHTAGEPVRLFTGGLPRLTGDTLLAKRRDAMERHDYVRRHLMLEPRGHSAMYGVWPLEPHLPEAALAVLFTHNEGYSTMCGHATIALGRWVIDQGLVAVRCPQTKFVLECPCGPVSVSVDVDEAGRPGQAHFAITGARATLLDAQISVPEIGKINIDVAYGGAYYAIVPASRMGLNLFETPYERLVTTANKITEAAREQLDIVHPVAPALGFLYGTILTDDAPAGVDAPSYNLCTFGGGQVDRSPTGSGVAARLALDFAKGKALPGLKRQFRGISGVGFAGELMEADETGVTVQVAGQGFYVGCARFWVERDDPLADGFTVPDVISPDI